MKHEPELVGEGGLSGAVSRNTEKHAEANRRQSAMQDKVDPGEIGEVIQAEGEALEGDDSVPADPKPKFTPKPSAGDAQLSWAIGNHFVSPGGPHDSPMTSTLAEVAGVSGGPGGPERAVPAFGHVTSAPNCSEGNWNMHDIIRGGKL